MTDGHLIRHGRRPGLALLLVTLMAAPVHAQTNADPTPPGPLGLSDLIALSLERNPALQQVRLDIEAARGQALQAGLYPNPTLGVMGDELGGREGPGGFITAPFVKQEIVTPGKLGLARSVADKEVDQATLLLVRQRAVLLTTVRQGYFEVLAARRRFEVLGELVGVANQSYELTRTLVKEKQAAKVDLLQLQAELNRLRTDHEAARRDAVAAWRRLAASMGVPQMPEPTLVGNLDAPFPGYDFDRASAYMLAVHPDVRSAQVGVTRAQLALRRAQLEPIPNVTAGAGYQRDNKGREDLWVFQVEMPIPVFNRNQGNIRSAQAELGHAVQEVSRVENELSGRLAGAFGQYSAARQRAEQYRTSILPDVREVYRVYVAAAKAGQFDYLRVLQAQRAVQEANLEYVRSLAEAWRAASEIAGLLLEEHWPF
jgi:cobalt-zinc-cadmium efflux system outer membrane protein